jgi:poly[(R)-3-hydroxyalkanoate] polymerase subunit PhaC
MADESPWDVADQAVGAIAPEVAEFGNPDFAEFARALAAAVRGSVLHPAASFGATLRLVTRLAPLPAIALGRWFGAELESHVDLDPKDRRFADPAWSDNPVFYSLRLMYEIAGHYGDELVDGSGVDALTREKAGVALGLLHDSLAPSNFHLTNPAVIKRGIDTAGKSVVDGAWNFVDDVLHNGGRPRQVDTSSFVLGKNLAATPSKVVYRNELMELLQYEQNTPKVHANPLLFSPPWINKYYVMDLAPRRSFVEWAVNHDRTVFAISYRNPGPEQAHVTLDDYLVHGPRQALDVVEDITGAQTIDVVGLCLGGAMTAITAAYLNGKGDSRVGTLTLLNTLLDYSDPGVLRVFTDRRAVERLEKQMARQGYLPGASMATTFDLLRPNDLIFNYVVSNWLMGQQPPAFDILAWNADSTRLPAAMHSFYLRNFYVENSLAKGGLELAGEPIRLADISQDTYLVGAENDHIVPWRSAYAAIRLLSGPVRFVLSSGGHIAGIVNPPGPKGWYLVADETPQSPSDWREKAARHAGSWWEDWVGWSREHAGPLVDPPPLGSDAYPVMGDGPGDYIRT